jgi:hypothetical protein
MSPALALIHQVRRRLLWHRQLNTLGFFLPLAVVGWLLVQMASQLLALSRLVVLLPVVVCGVGIGMSLRKIRMTTEPESIAALLDEKMQGKERFLTLVSALPHSPSLSDSASYSVVQQQTDQLSKIFLPKKELPFSFDRRVLGAGIGAICSVLTFLFSPFVSEYPFSSSYFSSQSEEAQESALAIAISTIEKPARLLLSPSSTPEEQLAGAQLLPLAQQLQDPSLSVPEKQKLIEEVQKRLTLDLPFPQFFPFDLKIFTGKGNEDQNQGKDGESPQAGKSQLAKANQNLEQLKQSLTGQLDNQAAQNEQKNKEKTEKPQTQAGGGITFNFPPQSPNPLSPPNNLQTPGTQQSQANPQTSPHPDVLRQPQNSQTSQVDPQRSGKDLPNQAQNSQNQGHHSEKSREEQKKTGEEGTMVGQGKGERFLKPGDEPGGGFLTKDAQFVKIRVPIALEEQGQGETLTEHTNRTTPKTRYSNVPLKEGQPDQPQAKQPIPLEYRSILTKER